jgi:hypothetical protein
MKWVGDLSRDQRLAVGGPDVQMREESTYLRQDVAGGSECAQDAAGSGEHSTTDGSVRQRWPAEPKLVRTPDRPAFAAPPLRRGILRLSDTRLVTEPKLARRASEGWWPRFVPDGTH